MVGDKKNRHGGVAIRVCFGWVQYEEYEEYGEYGEYGQTRPNNCSCSLNSV